MLRPVTLIESIFGLKSVSMVCTMHDGARKLTYQHFSMMYMGFLYRSD